MQHFANHTFGHWKFVAATEDYSNTITGTASEVAAELAQVEDGAIYNVTAVTSNGKIYNIDQIAADAKKSSTKKGEVFLSYDAEGYCCGIAEWVDAFGSADDRK